MAQGRVYTLVWKALTSLTTTAFAQLATPATCGIEIIRIELGQETSETSQQEVLTLERRSAASTLPTSTTPIAMNDKDPASLLTGSTTTNAVGIATAAGSTTSNPFYWCFNVLQGFLWLPVPEERLTVAPSSFVVLRFPTSPAANSWSGQITFRELN